MRVVVDWDGTATEVDGLHLILEEFGDVGVYNAAEERLGRTLSLHEVIALELESVRAPLVEGFRSTTKSRVVARSTVSGDESPREQA